MCQRGTFPNVLSRIFGYSPPESSETIEKVSVSTSFPQSRSWHPPKLPVSNESRSWHPPKLPVSDESRSQHLLNFMVSMSLGLDIFQIYQSRWVSVSTLFKFQSVYGKEVGETIFWAILGPKMPQKVTKKSRSRQLLSVSIEIAVSVSNLRLWILKSRSQIWDFGF